MINLSLPSSISGVFTLQNPKFSSHECFLNPSTSSLFTPKSPTKTLSLKCQYSGGQRQTFAQKPDTTLPPKVFVGHYIYKGKAALQVVPCAPEFAPLDSGAYKMSREGFMLLQFAPAAGVRQYDWSRKQVFSLSLTEMGTLMSLGTKDSCEFFHDPNIGRSDEGMIRKVFKVEPLSDGSGHFFNLSVQNKLQNLDESILLPVTKAEYTLLMSAFNYVVPYFMGWHAFTNSIRPEASNANSSFGADLEWSR